MNKKGKKMKVVKKKIVEITESELFELYLKRGMDEIMSFPDYKDRMESAGTKVTKG